MKLIKIGSQFAVDGQDLFELGSSLEMAEVLWNLGIEDSEIDAAFDALDAGDIVANFGVNNTFIFSKAA